MGNAQALLRNEGRSVVERIVCQCVHWCVCEREREGEREGKQKGSRRERESSSVYCKTREDKKNERLNKG